VTDCFVTTERRWRTHLATRSAEDGQVETRQPEKEAGVSESPENVGQALDTTPACVSPERHRIQEARAAVPAVLNVMQNERSEKPPPAPHKVVNAAKLARQLEEQGHRRDAAEWAIHELVQAGMLTAEGARVPIPNIWTGAEGIPRSTPRRYSSANFSGPFPFEKFVVRSTGALWQWFRILQDAQPSPIPQSIQTIADPLLRGSAIEVRQAALELRSVIYGWETWVLTAGRAIEALPDYGTGFDTPQAAISGMGEAIALKSRATVAVKALHGHECLPPSLRDQPLNDALSAFPSYPEGPISSERDKSFVEAVRQTMPLLRDIAGELTRFLNQLEFAPLSAIRSRATDPPEGKPREKEAKRRRGRPKGSNTAKRDLRLYRDWKAANAATGITKAEFLQERGLPESELSAIERGRKQADSKRKPGQNSLDK